MNVTLEIARPDGNGFLSPQPHAALSSRSALPYSTDLMMVFEQRHEPLLSRHLFLLRVVRWSAAAGVILLGSLAIGVLGYHYPGTDALD